MNLGGRFGRSTAGVALMLIALLAAPTAHAQAAKKGSSKTTTTKKSTAKKKTTTPAADDSNTVLVRVGKDVITRGDVQRRIETLPEQFRQTYTTPEGRQQLLDRMVEEKVWLSLAVKNGVADRPQVKQQLDQQRRDLLVRTYLNEVMAANPAPSDSEARAYYDAHITEYKVPATVTVRHILSKTENDSKKMLKWAQAKNAKWDDLVKKYSVDTLTKASGGSIGTVTPEGAFASIGSQPALAQAAFALSDGQVGGPVKTDKGWHVIKVENKKEESVRPFEQVRQMIVRQLSSQRSQDFYKGQLDDARKTLGVKPDSTAIKNFVSQKKSARDLFNEAQAITAPEARITAYRSLLQEHPDSDVSPQAQFMIGFIYSEELKNYDEAAVAFRELLRRYPKAELAPSAEWMLEHMREENAPPFIQMDGEPESAAPGKPGNSKSSTVSPASTGRSASGVKPWSPPTKADSAAHSHKGDLVKP
jgi:peptidyl-prolyl cis-trans isomerase C